MNKALKLRLEAIKLNCELAQDIMNAQSDKLNQIKSIVEGGVKLMESASRGFNKPYEGLDMSLIHGRLLRILELRK